MVLGEDAVVDAQNPEIGNWTAYIDRHCNPNACITRWIMDGVPFNVILSTRQIQPDEQITMEYDLNYGESCMCGDANCKKQNCNKQTEPKKQAEPKKQTPLNKKRNQSVNKKQRKKRQRAE